jgi:hypothetical protein
LSSLYSFFVKQKNYQELAVSEIFKNEIFFILEGDYTTYIYNRKIQNKEELENKVKNKSKYKIDNFKEIKNEELFTIDFEKHQIDFNLFKIAMYLTENNFYYADLLLEKYNIVELYTKYLYKLVVNYKN